MVGRGARVPRVEWTEDPAFGYEVGASVPDVDDIEILQLCGLYERTGRAADYAGMAGKMKRERSKYLASFDGLAPSILKSIAHPPQTCRRPERPAARARQRHPFRPLFAGSSGSLDTFSIG